MSKVERGMGSWRGLALLAAAALLPLLVLAVHVRVELRPTFPFGDLAYLELETIDATQGARLVGQHSRFGFFHPGPALFYVLAIPYGLTGYEPYGLSLGALLIAWLSFSGVLGVTSQVAPRVTPLAVALLLLLIRFFDRNVLFNFWSPVVIVLPTALFLALSALIAVGRTRWLPAAAALASFLAQAYAANLVVLLLVGMAAVVCGIRAERARLRSVLLATLAVLVLFWSPTAIDALGDGATNLRKMADFALKERPAIPWSECMAAVADRVASPVLYLQAPNPWDRIGESERPLALGVAFVQVALLCTAFVVSLRRRRSLPAALCGLGLLALVGSVWAARGAERGVFAYMIGFVVAIGMVNWIAIACAFLGPSTSPTRGTSRLWLAGVLGGLGVVLLVWSPPVNQNLSDPAVGKLERRLRMELAAHEVTGPVRVVDHGETWLWSTAVAARLWREGFSLCFDHGLYGPRWRCGEAVRHEAHFFPGDDPSTAEWRSPRSCKAVIKLVPISEVCVHVEESRAVLGVALPR